MDKSVLIDPQLFTIILTIVGGIVTSLIGIIVWLAKGMKSSIDDTAKGLEKIMLEYSVLKEGMTTIKDDMRQMKSNLNELSVIKGDVIRNSGDIGHMKSMLEEYKALATDTAKQMREMERKFYNSNK